MDKFRNSLALAKASWEVLRQDKQLLVLPLLSFLATAVTIALFGVGIYATGDRSAGFTPSVVGWALAVAAYCVLAITTVYFNAALVSAANERLSGGDPTIDSALAGANAHLPQIIGWGLVSATVSMILRQIQENSGLVGRIISGVVGIAWSLVTFLVLPVIVIENAGITAAVTRSKQLFRQTWGERVVGNAGIGIIGLLASLPAILVIVLGVASGLPIAMLATIAIGGLWIAVVACVTSAMSMIFSTSLYRFAALGETGAWDANALNAAFTSKPARRSLFGG